MVISNALSAHYRTVHINSGYGLFDKQDGIMSIMRILSPLYKDTLELRLLFYLPEYDNDRRYYQVTSPTSAIYNYKTI